MTVITIDHINIPSNTPPSAPIKVPNTYNLHANTQCKSPFHAQVWHLTCVVVHYIDPPSVRVRPAANIDVAAACERGAEGATTANFEGLLSRIESSWRGESAAIYNWVCQWCNNAVGKFWKKLKVRRMKWYF